MPNNASKLQTPEYGTSKEAFESILKVHGHKDFIALEGTDVKENHLEVEITDLVAEENRSKKIIDTAEIILIVQKLNAIQICRRTIQMNSIRKKAEHKMKIQHYSLNDAKKKRVKDKECNKITERKET